MKNAYLKILVGFFALGVSGLVVGVQNIEAACHAVANSVKVESHRIATSYDVAYQAQYCRERVPNGYFYYFNSVGTATRTNDGDKELCCYYQELDTTQEVEPTIPNPGVEEDDLENKCFMTKMAWRDDVVNVEDFCSNKGAGACQPVCPTGYRSTKTGVGVTEADAVCPYGVEDGYLLEFSCAAGTESVSNGVVGSCQKCRTTPPGKCLTETKRPEGSDWVRVNDEVGVAVATLGNSATSLCATGEGLIVDPQRVDGDKACWYKCMKVDFKAGEACTVGQNKGTLIEVSAGDKDALVTAYGNLCQQTWARPSDRDVNTSAVVVDKLLAGNWLKTYDDNSSFYCGVCPCSDLGQEAFLIDAKDNTGTAKTKLTVETYLERCGQKSSGITSYDDVYASLLNSSALRSLSPSFANLSCAVCNASDPSDDGGETCVGGDCLRCDTTKFNGELYKVDAGNLRAILEKYPDKFTERNNAAE